MAKRAVFHEVGAVAPERRAASRMRAGKPSNG
jgi:hypothetical protein